MPDDRAWINPIGGLGDALMLSGVLKLVHERTPAVRYHLVRRTRYQSILREHPAIDRIGFAPRDARIVPTDYWTHGPLGDGRQRAFQILARMFGLPTPVEERLYLPGTVPSDDPLLALVPFGTRRVITVAPASDSPRKMWPLQAWEQLTRDLGRQGTFVVQVGRNGDLRIPGAYCLIGLTTPHQLVAVLQRSAVVVTVDNLVMHAAHLAGTPAIVLWGPTDPGTYGYAEQVHLRGAVLRCAQRSNCLGPRYPDHYGAPCPAGDEHCMAAIDFRLVREAVASRLC